MSECKRMDHHKRNQQRPPTVDGSTMNSSPASSQARQVARNKGLAWVSAITLGAGAASALGAGVIAVSLRSPSTATTASSATTAVSTSTNSEDDDSGLSQQAAPLKAAPAPVTSSRPPVATSAAS